jgi:DUF1680 family protein
MAQPLQDLPLKDVKLTGDFWGKRLETNRTVTIWHNFKECEKTGRIANFKKAAGLQSGGFEGIFFNDSDVYKVLEGAAYILAQHPDGKLDKYCDDLIAVLAKAQRDDGYLYTFYQLNGMEKRYTNLKDNHELYCAGHLIEAAVAHHQATGKKNFLDIAIKLADFIDASFGPDKKIDVDGHEEIELALIKLADETGDAKYRKLAEFFLHERGRGTNRKLYGPYYQDHKPLVDCDGVVGHAVRQMYLVCAATDLALRGDDTYVPALNRLWNDMTTGKLYITGGVGARHEGEAFGEAFELPNERAYAETCAGIGNALWNHRMLLLTGDSKYADEFERALYNGFLSGVSLKGDTFFYVNPLASKGGHHRTRWFDCACCPPNVLRFMASLPQRVYSVKDDAIHVNHFASGEAIMKVAGAEVKLTQETRYPWDGKIKLTLAPEKRTTCAIKLRIPEWCKGANIAINGNSPGNLVQNGYAVIHGDWKAGDVIEMDLPMEIERVKADPRVKDNAGRVAIRRGPIVYCAEGVDNGGKAMELKLPADVKLIAEHRDDLLGGVTVIKAGDITLVPYYAWDNREPGEMAVWLAE